MSTSQTTVDYLLDQLIKVPNVTARKMFGEYALYVNKKVVALVCEETLFIKITPEGKDFVGQNYEEGHAYIGAKASMVISEELIDDREWLSDLVTITAQNLPAPKPKKKT